MHGTIHRDRRDWRIELRPSKLMLIPLMDGPPVVDSAHACPFSSHQ